MAKAAADALHRWMFTRSLSLSKSFPRVFHYQCTDSADIRVSTGELLNSNAGIEIFFFILKRDAKHLANQEFESSFFLLFPPDVKNDTNS